MIGRCLVNTDDTRSLAARFRRKGFEVFRRLAAPLPRPVTVLDIGGTARFWDAMLVSEADGFHVTLVNLVPQETGRSWMTSVVADAVDLSWIADKSFDVAFSYSLIEHVGGPARQRQAATEILRIGRRYFVQTPNYWFPIEPHFLFPAFHWLPLTVRAWLVRRLRLGWIERIPDQQQARRAVEGISLLSRNDLRGLFPDATLYEARMLGLVQSFIAYGGW